MICVKNMKYYYDVKLFKFSIKKYDKCLIIDNFEVKEGEKVAIVGLNGSGKSTFFKLLIGILKPDMGEICANGFDPWLNRKIYVNDIGVVWGQRSTLWWDLPVIESFYAIQAIYKIHKDDFEMRLKD
ncbi:MAG: ATP-binding cassette domain-containing protein, partial [Filifactoraceae bacterium]